MTQYIEQLEIALNRTDQPSDFYSTASLQQHLDLLTHLTQFSELLLCINGPEGIGKTSLIQAFVSKRHDNWRTCLLHAQDIANPQQLIQQLFHQFDLPSPGKQDTPQQALIEYFEKLQLAAQLPIIIIDDADQLDTETLRVLLYLAPELHTTLATVRILLSGHQALQERLKEIGFYDTSNPPIHEIELVALDAEQTTDYLEQRIHAANLPIDFPFSTQEMQLIYQESQGIPLQIHERALHYYRQQVSTIEPLPTPKSEVEPSVIKRYFPAAFISIILFALLWWQDDINQFLNAHKNSRDKPQQELRLPQARQSILEVTQAPVIDSAMIDPIDEPIDILAEPAADTSANPVTADEATVEAVAETAAKATEPQQSTDPEPLPVAQPEKIEPAMVTPKPQAVTPTEPQPIPETRDKPLLHQQDWLLQQDPNHYTLQLLSARKQESIVEFSNKFKLEQEVAHFYHEVKGQGWHVITAGIYPSYAAAKQAISSLPKPLQSNKPWPRRLSSIQQAIRQLDNNTP